MEVWRTHGINNYGFGIIPAGGGRFWVPSWERNTSPVREFVLDDATGRLLPVAVVELRLKWTLARGGDKIDGWDFGASYTKNVFRKLPENFEHVADWQERAATVSYLLAPLTGGASLPVTKGIQGVAIGFRVTATALEGINALTIGSDPKLVLERLGGLGFSVGASKLGQGIAGLKPSGVSGPVFRNITGGQFAGNVDAAIRLSQPTIAIDLLILMINR